MTKQGGEGSEETRRVQAHKEEHTKHTETPDRSFGAHSISSTVFEKSRDSFSR